jgi:cytosine/adenosine deaminase-related metal-dependent hydrolase
MEALLIHSGTLVCMDAAGTVERGDLLVVGDRIHALGADVPEALEHLPAGTRLNRFAAEGCLVLPGFVHGHLHLCQTLFRGLAEQSDLLHWLRESIWPLEHAHDEASIAAAARLGLCELVAGGVTCINDMGTVRHTEALGEVLAQVGIRALFGPALMDTGDGVPDGMLMPAPQALHEVQRLARRFDHAEGGRLRVSLAPRFILSCSDELWHDVAALSRERGMLVHTHIAESATEGAAVKAAKSRHAAPYFQEQGILSERFVGAHGVFLDDEELQLMRRADAALVHCPGSNLKLASGLADVSAWKRHGIRCGLGSDGAACNNRLDTFTEMGLAGGITRVKHSGSPLSARDIVALATIDGARALGLAERIGSLEVGKQADITCVDVDTPRCAPFGAREPYAAIAHSANSSDVTLTMVAGKVLYDWGEWKTLDPLNVVADAHAQADALLARAGIANHAPERGGRA